MTDILDFRAALVGTAVSYLITPTDMTGILHTFALCVVISVLANIILPHVERWRSRRRNKPISEDPVNPISLAMDKILRDTKAHYIQMIRQMKDEGQLL